MLCLTCTMLSSVDLAHYGVSHAKDWVSVDSPPVIYVYHKILPNENESYLILVAKQTLLVTINNVY